MTYILLAISVISICWLFKSFIDLINSDLTPLALRMFFVMITIGVLLYNAL
jgi:hypothetical protein